MTKKTHIWRVYILRCADDSLYTGITNNIQKRFEAHRRGKGGNYTRTHKPVQIVYTEGCETRSKALKREAAIKRFSRLKKLNLVRQVGSIVEYEHE